MAYSGNVTNESTGEVQGSNTSSGQGYTSNYSSNNNNYSAPAPIEQISSPEPNFQLATGESVYVPFNPIPLTAEVPTITSMDGRTYEDLTTYQKFDYGLKGYATGGISPSEYLQIKANTEQIKNVAQEIIDDEKIKEEAQEDATKLALYSQDQAYDLERLRIKEASNIQQDLAYTSVWEKIFGTSAEETAVREMREKAEAGKSYEEASTEASKYGTIPTETPWTRYIVYGVLAIAGLFTLTKVIK